MRNPDALGDAAREAAALDAAGRAGCAVPAVDGAFGYDGRPGPILQRIDGPDLLSVIEKRPWTVVSAARTMGRVHAELHRVVAPRELPSVKLVLESRIKASEEIPSDLAGFALDVLKQLPDGDRLCHGDFHPGNILVSERGPFVVDWINAGRGEPAGDVARTNLLLKLGSPPRMSLAMRALVRFGRGVVTSVYNRSYGAVDRAQVGRWMIPHAAARVSEGISEEVPTLLRFLSESHK